MSKHTPGPWKYDPDAILSAYTFNDETGQPEMITVTGEYLVSHVSGQPVCEVIKKQGNKKRHVANARLIAAAPDLLEACQQIVHTCHQCQHLEDKYQCRYCGRARAAIDKARGGNQEEGE